ncbi:MAG: pyridoxal phosphate-dependent aminotransferase family protein, partial [Nitrosopumilaceae archaeon]|nr:pyridoxal phosphate-dependent aminotransferase family protein [Nitrosopumilaceae archaeon]NIU86694.1 pyridoxal phosphate-dependent aminotransferase family protein [Nitrosopumilaceae archaeon]NIV65389.1 pyridoxal phosphate-dependent aminotransferase family protein [Nitrosopumilaceae archaeon]NIX60884.1 pyridoxal phosphate-dependent aminotransferase family protein [Nitrosopumilaceae archaeon]
LGSFGGYVATENKAVELLVNKSKSFIYTSALPSVIAQDALKRFESNREKQRIKLEKNTLEFRKGLNSIGYKIESKSHIIPI